MSIIQAHDLNGSPSDKHDLPKVFTTPIRPDLIKKAVLAQQSHKRQSQGRNPMAGKRTSAESIGTGYGIARMARVKGSGYPKARQAAFVPSTVGGRRTHPRKAEKNIYQKINKKERRLAIRSAIAATADKNLVASRGHIIDEVPNLPLVLSDDLQEISTAKEAKAIFAKFGLLSDVQRVKESKKIRAGKGTMRGRKRRHSIGPLIVINEDKGIKRAVSNFLGIDVSKAEDLNIELLAPGTSIGRLTIWTSSAFNKLDDVFKGV